MDARQFLVSKKSGRSGLRPQSLMLDTRTLSIKKEFGEGGIRTLDTRLNTYVGLANRCLQPLGHLSSNLSIPNIKIKFKEL